MVEEHAESLGHGGDAAQLVAYLGFRFRIIYPHELHTFDVDALVTEYSDAQALQASADGLQVYVALMVADDELGGCFKPLEWLQLCLADVAEIHEVAGNHDAVGFGGIRLPYDAL